MTRSVRLAAFFSVGLALGGFTALCSAQPVTYAVTSGFTSWHGKDGREYRENNYGLGLQARRGELAGAIGYYRNSLDRDSFYAGAVWTPDAVAWAVPGGMLHLGVMGGIVTGYRDGVTPMAVPVVEYRHRSGLAVRLAGIPPIPGVTPATAALQVVLTIKD